MNRVMWAVKRAHWRCWAAAKKALREEKSVLTPARYEVLHVLFHADGAMAQRALQRALGVVRSTLSEALKKIEELGLVERGVRTARGRKVTLTDLGRDAYSFEGFVALESLDFAIERAFPDDNDVYMLETICLVVRRAYDDFGPQLLYEWTDYDH